MNSRKKRTRAPRPSLRESSDQGELAALLSPSEPATPPPAASLAAAPALAAPAVEVEQGVVTFSIDEISTAVRYWGDHLEDKGAAKVSGGFGPNACVVIEVLTLMSVNRERTVACKQGTKLAQLVNGALQASPLLQPIQHSVDAVA